MEITHRGYATEQDFKSIEPTEVEEPRPSEETLARPIKKGA